MNLLGKHVAVIGGGVAGLTAVVFVTKAISYLRNMVAIISETGDSKEGRTAFIEKRKPVWRE